MDRLGIIAVVVLTAGCNPQPQSPPTSRPAPPASTQPTSIGPQFWKYDLNEYSIVANDEFSGLGGRWISLRYRQPSNEGLTRKEMVTRITAALLADGWQQGPLPQQKYVLSKIWETSSDDLHFTRGAKPCEPADWFFAQTVFVSEDADTLAIYCEVGW